MRKLFTFIKTYFALLVVIATFAWSASMIAVYRNRNTPPGATIIRIGHWQLEASVRDGIEQMAREYRKTHPNVYVIQDAIPESVYGQWVSTQLMGGTAPDLVQVGAMLPANIWLSYYNRYFTPLTREVNHPNPYNAANDLARTPLRQTFKDGMRTAYVFEMQEYMSIPLSQFGVRIFYNKTLLKKLTGSGDAPKDYRSFLAACQKITEQTNALGQRYIAIASSGYHMGMWEGMLFDPMTYGIIRKADYNRDADVGNNELYVAFKTKALDFYYPPIEARFRMIREVTDYFQTGFTGLTRDEAVFLFAQQKAVFMTTGTWDARSLQKLAEGQFEVGVMEPPLPAKDDPEFGSIIEGPNYEQAGTGFQFGITRTSKHPDLALDFMLFMASRQHNQELNSTIGWIPAIVGTDMDPMLKAFEPHLEGVYGAFSIWLGGETATRWMQCYDAFKIHAISYDELVKNFHSFYIDQGMKDFMEQQRDWRRGMHQNERFLGGIRAKALLAADPEERNSSWVRYRALTKDRQVWAEIDHSRQLQLIEQGPQETSYGPYEYRPEVIEKIKQRLKQKMKEESKG